MGEEELGSPRRSGVKQLLLNWMVSLGSIRLDCLTVTSAQRRQVSKGVAKTVHEVKTEVCVESIELLARDCSASG